MGEKIRKGVYIEKGPEDFEIVQQDSDGCAELTWSGFWVMGEDYDSIDVYARVLLENSGEEVIAYTCCERMADKWSVTMRIPAGGLYKLETGWCVNDNPVKSWNIMGDMRHFFGVGDVFVLAGQSNSAGFGLGVVQDEPVLGVHALKLNDRWQIASHPLGDGTDAKHIESLSVCNLGHSPYIHFGKILYQHLNYPIGLIPTSRGGASLGAWNPAEDGDLYRNMLDITQNLTNGYKAVVWYQGCTEGQRKDAWRYGERFQNMVECWRKDSGYPELPFFTTQLNRYLREADTETDQSWGMVQEAQRLAPYSIPYCFILPSSDIPMSDTIHNSSMGCMMLGERLAYQVLYHLYQLGKTFTSTDLTKVEQMAEDSINLEFGGSMDSLETFDVPASELDIIVRDCKGCVELCDYKVRGGSIVLYLKREISGSCTISCGSRKKTSGMIPVDRRTYMPVLSFYEVPVMPKKGECI